MLQRGKWTTFILVGVLSTLLLTSPALAEGEKLGEKKIPQWLQKKKSSTSSSSASLVIALFSLVIILGAVAFIGRKCLPQGGHYHPDKLDMVAQLSLGPGQKLARIKAGDREFVIAISRDKISMLVDLEEKELTKASDRCENEPYLAALQMRGEA